MSEDYVKNEFYEPLETNTWGFNSYSEKINGRLAMVGFFIVLFFEILTKQKIINFIP
jgi:hypothetical protein